MKKNIYLLLIATCLFSCNKNIETSKSDNVHSDDTAATTSESNVPTSIVSETSSSDSLSMPTEFEQTTTFANISEIYISINETYNLSKMINSIYKIELFKIEQDNDCISITNGIIKGMKEGDTKLSLIKNNTIQNIDVHVTNYDEYGSYFISTDIGRFYNKNVVFFGDSITHNWYKYTHDMELVPGYDGKSECGYVKMLNDKCNFASITNAACSGGTMSTLITKERPLIKSFDYCVENNKENIKNADYIFIWYGTNDYTDQAEISKSSFEIATSANEKSSFDGAMRYGLEKIKQYNLNAQIIVFNLLYRSYPANGNKYSIDDYNNTIDQICLQYLCKKIDVNSLFNSENYTKYLNNDGLHPNDDGYRVITDYILNNGEKK